MCAYARPTPLSARHSAVGGLVALNEKPTQAEEKLENPPRVHKRIGVLRVKSIAPQP
jgi:hypothetical protein